MRLVVVRQGLRLLALCLAVSEAHGAVYPPLKPVWQIDCDQGFYAPPTVVDGTVYASDVAGGVRAVSLAEGTVKWSFTATDSIYSGVAVAGGLGYVGSVDKTLYALDLATGQPKWTKELDGVIYATPVVAGATVLVGTGDAGGSGTVYALDAATGAERWTFQLGGRMGSGLAVADGLVFVGSYDKRLYALDLAKGKPRWQFVGETVIDSMPLSADRVVYVKLTNDAVCALDGRTGQAIWRTTPLLAEVTDQPSSWSPLAKVGDRLLLALSDGRLRALDAATGEQVWITAMGPVRPAPPAVVGDVGFVGSKDGSLCALDMDTGTKVWEWRPEPVSLPGLLNGIMWPPVVAGKWVLAASMDGHLYAFEGGTDAAAWQTARQVATGPSERLGAGQRGPGRIAVGGLFPVGYVGCLARHGLPRDLLYDAQLADLKTLQAYDLVIVAGAPDNPSISAAVQKYVEAGGTAIVDYSATAIPQPNLPNGKELVGWARGKSAAPGGFGVRGLSLATLPVAANAGPLAGIPLADGLVGEKSLGYVPDPAEATDVQVLASYPSTLVQRKDAPQAEPTGGPAGPAILAARRGQGRVILCGLQVGLHTQYAGFDLESLIVALVRLATNGRAVPQLVPDMPHVGRSATLSSVSAGAAGAKEATSAPAGNGPTEGPGERAKLPKGYTLLEADPADEYFLTAQVPPRGGELLLRYWNADNYVRVKVSPSSVDIARCSHGRTQPLESAKVDWPAGQSLAIKDTCDKLTVRSGGSYLKVDLSGLHQGSVAQRGLGNGVEYQPTESVYFTDDFMRTDQNQGAWQTTGGEWSTTPEQNPDMGANPFSFKCQAPDGVATALAGYDFWQDYQFTCAVRPTSGADTGGTVGIGWYAKDPDNMYLVRAAVRKDLDPLPHGFQLIRLVDGVPTVLAEHAGGVNEGQWYELHVKAEGPWIAADVDGVRVLTTKDTTFSGGKLALRVDHGAARFDDVRAIAAVLPLEAGARLGSRAPNHAGLIDVDSWANPAAGWEADPHVDGLLWQRGTFYGDIDFDFAWPDVPDGSEVNLLVDADGETLNSGYTLRLQRSGETGHVELRGQGRAIKAVDVPLGEQVSLGFHRRVEPARPDAPSVRLEALLGGRTVLSATVPTLANGGRLGFRAVGFLPGASALTVWSPNLADDTFDTAPCGWWVSGGTWELTNRWSCEPEWSWFGGFSEQQAAIWYRQQFVGDLVLDYYVGAKMLNAKVPGYRGKDQERTGDFNVTLCGDGRSTDTGYSFTVGSDGSASGGGAQLRRNGQVVAQNDGFRFFSLAHNRWANLRAEKHGATVSLAVDGQVLLEYRDPEPLDRGFVAIWTQNNGILMPRITLTYEGLGEELLSLR